MVHKESQLSSFLEPFLLLPFELRFPKRPFFERILGKVIIYRIDTGLEDHLVLILQKDLSMPSGIDGGPGYPIGGYSALWRN